MTIREFLNMVGKKYYDLENNFFLNDDSFELDKNIEKERKNEEKMELKKFDTKETNLIVDWIEEDLDRCNNFLNKKNITIPESIDINEKANIILNIIDDDEYTAMTFGRKFEENVDDWNLDFEKGKKIKEKFLDIQPQKNRRSQRKISYLTTNMNLGRPGNSSGELPMDSIIPPHIQERGRSRPKFSNRFRNNLLKFTLEPYTADINSIATFLLNDENIFGDRYNIDFGRDLNRIYFKRNANNGRLSIPFRNIIVDVLEAQNVDNNEIPTKADIFMNYYLNNPPIYTFGHFTIDNRTYNIANIHNMGFDNHHFENIEVIDINGQYLVQRNEYFFGITNIDSNLLLFVIPTIELTRYNYNQNKNMFLIAENMEEDENKTYAFFPEDYTTLII